MRKKHQRQDENALAYLFKMTWNYSPKKSLIVIYWILFIVGNILVLVIHPMVMAKIIKTVTEQRGFTPETTKQLLVLMGLSVASTLIFWIFHGPARLIERCNANRAEFNYKMFLLRGVIALPYEWHTHHHTGNTVDKIEKGSSNLYTFASQSFAVIMVAARTLVSLGVLMYFSLAGGLGALAFLVVGFFFNRKFDKKIVRNEKIISFGENKLSEKVYDTMSCVKTIITLRGTEQIFDPLQKKFLWIEKIFRKNNVLIEVKWFLLSMLMAVMYVTVLGIYFWQHRSMAIPMAASTVFLLIRYLDELNEIMFRMVQMYSEIMVERAKVANAEVLSQEFGKTHANDSSMVSLWKTIEINDVHHKYKDSRGSVHQLIGASVHITRGRRIAFLGKTGCGKSTFLRIIRGLHKPLRSSIKIDGIVAEKGISIISHEIALIPQEPEIMAKTIRENITLGKVYPPHLIDRCIKIACFEDVVAKLPFGLDTSVNERGVKLSGGEKQRLALARALLASMNESIILLDEPTSSIDARTSRQILENIFREFPDKTFIVSLHQLQLLSYFDEIHFFEEGRIQARGTLNELITTSSQFSQLWESAQSSREGREEVSEVCKN